MRREQLRNAVAAAGLALLCGGCSMPGLGGRIKATPPAQVTESHESQLIADYLRTLARLGTVGNAEQAEIADAARRAVSIDASTTNRLKLALILAMPGHAASNLTDGRAQLTELLASPERLLPLERSFAAVMLASLDARAATDAENQRLRSEASRQDRERISALNRRLQALVEENEDLHKSLNEANAKLDAIATLERQMSGERRSGGAGAKP